MLYSPKENARITINFLHQDGNTYTWSFRADALYSFVRDGELPEEIRVVFYVDFPAPANSRWVAMDRPRDEMITMLASLLKPYVL